NIKVLDMEIIRQKKRREEIVERKLNLDIQIESLEREGDEIDSTLSQFKTEKEQNEKLLQEFSTRLDAMDQTRRKFQQELKQTGMALMESRNNLEQNKYMIAKTQQDMEEAVDNIKQKREALGRDQLNIQESEALIRETNLKISESNRTLREMEQKRDIVRENYRRIQNQMDELRSNNKILQKSLQEIKDKIHSYEMQITQNNEKQRSMRERIWEAYEIDLESIPEDFENVEIQNREETLERIDLLKNRLKKLGQVNMGVLEDFENESNRLNLLTEQRDDLTSAKDKLEKAIRELDRTARKRFLETFEKVKTNFREVFLTLFEGGEVKINLEQGVDPLLAKIEINARPGGKTMKGINLLSGGERALTAISLLFALYLVKPSPYCILDEVDAPLDDPNTTRFVNILKRFCHQTQFLVVTHNKRTMEASDILYGVTQQEPGISRTVSVKVKDIKSLNENEMVLSNKD
ncbi:MAG: hypothetical protein ABIA63_01535, partial [bacterium]